jgi:hypothetical protein
MKNSKPEWLVGSSESERKARKEFLTLFNNTPIPQDQILKHLGLFIKRQELSRILMFNELYQKIIDIKGIICEFGVGWGQNLSLFISLRGMYEPYNFSRKIVGFDTFEGFPSVHEKDGILVKTNMFPIVPNYEEYLEKILLYQESESPINHKIKFGLIKGDASKTIVKYLSDHPETIISFAYFDFDLYKPTLDCLKAILPHLSKGAVIGFDELNLSQFPGETIAFKEVFKLDKVKINRNRHNPLPSYIIYE